MGKGVSLCALDLHHAPWRRPCAQLGLCLPLMSRHPQPCLVCHSQPAATHHTTSRLGQSMVVPLTQWHACRVRGPVHDLASSAELLSTAPACLLMPAKLPLHPCATPAWCGMSQLAPTNHTCTQGQPGELRAQRRGYRCAASWPSRPKRTYNPLTPPPECLAPPLPSSPVVCPPLPAWLQPAPGGIPCSFSQLPGPWAGLQPV